MNSLHAFLSPVMEPHAFLSSLVGSDSSPLPSGPSRIAVTNSLASWDDAHCIAAPTRTPLPPGVVHTPNVLAAFPAVVELLEVVGDRPGHAADVVF